MSIYLPEQYRADSKLTLSIDSTLRAQALSNALLTEQHLGRVRPRSIASLSLVCLNRCANGVHHESRKHHTYVVYTNYTRRHIVYIVVLHFIANAVNS